MAALRAGQTSQGHRLQRGICPVPGSAKQNIIFHLLGHVIQESVHGTPATVSVLIVDQNCPVLGLRGLLCLLGCVLCYLPFPPVSPTLLVSEVLKNQHCASLPRLGFRRRLSYMQRN